MGVTLPRPSRSRRNIDRAHANFPYANKLTAKIILKKISNGYPRGKRNQICGYIYLHKTYTYKQIYIYEVYDGELGICSKLLQVFNVLCTVYTLHLVRVFELY